LTHTLIGRANGTSSPASSISIRAAPRSRSLTHTDLGGRSLHRPPDTLRGRGASEIGDAKWRQRIEDRVGDRREGADGTALAAAFDPERVGRARRAVKAQVV